MAFEQTVSVINTTDIATDLLGYIADNQEEALARSTPDDYGALKPIQKFYNSAEGRATTVFPMLMIVEEAETGGDEESDLSEAFYSIRFELRLTGGDGEQLVKDGKYYAHALKTMLNNAVIVPTGEELAGRLDRRPTVNYGLRGGGAGAFGHIIRIEATFKFYGNQDYEE